MVQKGKLAAYGMTGRGGIRRALRSAVHGEVSIRCNIAEIDTCAASLPTSALKRVLLPTLGSPTMPVCSFMDTEARPRLSAEEGPLATDRQGCIRKLRATFIVVIRRSKRSVDSAQSILLHF